jgi:hypothetical protein
MKYRTAEELCEDGRRFRIDTGAAGFLSSMAIIFNT